MPENTQQAQGRISTNVRDDIAELGKSIPLFGPIISFIIRRGWWGFLAVLIIFLGVLPLLIPLLGAAYLALLPTGVRHTYTDYVINAFSIEDRISEQVKRIIEENNDNLDFVELFHINWTNPNQFRFPVYKFPLKRNQTFDVQLEINSVDSAEKPCLNRSSDTTEAELALNDSKLFQVSVNGGAAAFIADGQPSKHSNRYNKLNFWDKTAGTPVDEPEPDTGIVKISLDTDRGSEHSSPAARVLKCYTLATDLRIIVYKTLLWNGGANETTVSGQQQSRADPNGALK